jgi:hypothetical protein
MEIAKLVLEYVRVFIWPITTVVSLLIFRKPISELFSRIRRAELPGGVSLNLGDQIDEATTLSERVRTAPPPADRPSHAAIPLTKVNARMVHLELRPVPSGLDLDYFRDLARRDPTLALSALRIELETLAKNLAKGSKLGIPDRESLSNLLALLLRSGVITGDQFSLAQRIQSVSNAAIHGAAISTDEVLTVIDAAKPLVDDYVAWLSWAFDDGWDPSDTNAEKT